MGRQGSTIDVADNWATQTTGYIYEEFYEKQHSCLVRKLQEGQHTKSDPAGNCISASDSQEWQVDRGEVSLSPEAQGVLPAGEDNAK